MQPRECASCGYERPICTRGLCFTCRWRHRQDGTVAEFGYVKADRLADFAALRASHPVELAARRLGVCGRTGWRYEAELRDARSATWPSARAGCAA